MENINEIFWKHQGEYRNRTARYQDTCMGRSTSLNCLCSCFCLHCHPSRRFWVLSPFSDSEFLYLFSFYFLFFFFGGCDTFCDSSLRNLGGCDLCQSLAASSNRKSLRWHRVLKDSAFFSAKNKGQIQCKQRIIRTHAYTAAEKHISD